MLVRCEAVRETGLLDEQFWAYAEDLDWSVRFQKRGYHLAFTRGTSLGTTTGPLPLYRWVQEAKRSDSSSARGIWCSSRASISAGGNYRLLLWALALVI